MAASMELEFKINQEVVNPLCPQWGVGRVISAEPGLGGKGLRVRVNFDGAGVKTMMIPPGKLVKPGMAKDAAASPAQDAAAPEDETALARRLQAIPAVIEDRHAAMAERVEALAKLFKYSEDRRSIFEWAMVQLGCQDPLRFFSADDLGLYFSNFGRSRDRALKMLYQEVRRAGQEEKLLSELKRKMSGDSYRRVCTVLEVKV
jgi:hypothetical protein